MKYAESIKDIPNAFVLGPLENEDFDTYYIDTMEVRTGDPYYSPTQDIFDACELPSGSNCFLFLGHKGCGKSTELNKLSEKLKKEGFPTYSILCGQEIDLLNITYTDLLILMGDALVRLADDYNVSIKKSIEKEIYDFWRIDGETTTTFGNDADIEIEAGAEGEAGILSIFKVFTKLKSSLKFNTSEHTTYTEKLDRRLSDWVMMLRNIIDAITEEAGRQPVLIFEDLDKLEPTAAWRVFYNYSATLSALSCPVIYTFPIALSYDAKFSALDSYFKTITLPMIKINNPDGTRCEEGYHRITQIIKARMDTALFSKDTLAKMIEKTGGSLRNLFEVIIDASRRADRRKSTTVDMEDAEFALGREKSILTRRIDAGYYDFLADICKGNRERIENKEMLLEMLQAGTVLEYNGKRWHDVHPLVKDFLTEQGFLE